MPVGPVTTTTGALVAVTVRSLAHAESEPVEDRVRTDHTYVVPDVHLPAGKATPAASPTLSAAEPCQDFVASFQYSLLPPLALRRKYQPAWVSPGDTGL